MPSLYKNIKENISLMFLLLLCFYSLMPFAIMSISLILFALTAIIFKYKHAKENFNKIPTKHIISQTGFYLIMCFSILYSSNKEEGINELQRLLPLLILPICFFYFTEKITAKKLKNILLTFVASKLLYIIYIYNYFVYRIGISKQFDVEDMSYLEKIIFTIKLPFKSVINNAINVANNPPKIFFHKAYLSMSLLFAICIVAYYFIIKSNKFTRKTILGLLLISLFTLVLFHWFSVTNLALFFLLGFVFFMCLFSNIKHKVIAGFSLLLFAIITINLPPIQKVINKNKSFKNNIEEAKSFMKSPLSKEDNKIRKGSRSAINECNIELMNSALIFGYGVGSPKLKLKECYEEKDFELGILYNLNSHNYYFHTILSVGILGFIAFMIMFVFNYKIALSSLDLLYISFLIIISVNLLTENIIFRAHGVLFFTLFNSLFYKYQLDNN